MAVGSKAEGSTVADSMEHMAVGKQVGSKDRSMVLDMVVDSMGHSKVHIRNRDRSSSLLVRKLLQQQQSLKKEL